MYKLITFITAAIALTSCGGNNIENIVPEDEKLPLTYFFDAKEESSGVRMEGTIIFDEGCFYSDFLGSRMAIVFPHTFRWNNYLNLVEANSKTIKSGQEIMGGAVVMNRSEFIKTTRHFISDETCLTDELILLHNYFE